MFKQTGVEKKMLNQIKKLSKSNLDKLISKIPHLTLKNKPKRRQSGARTYKQERTPSQKKRREDALLKEKSKLQSAINRLENNHVEFPN